MTPDSGPVLLAISRAAIARTLGAQAEAREDAHWLADPGATFVTLKKKGELRGCIGSLEARRPLLQDVKSNAVAAAFRDPRFPPVAWGELDELTVEVSLLSPMSSIEFAERGRRDHPVASVRGRRRSRALGYADYVSSPSLGRLAASG